MANVDNVKREELVKLMAKYIKACHKGMGDRTNMEVDVELSNWGSGFGKNWKWTKSIACIGNKGYQFTDKAIEDKEFISMLNKALEQSKVRGKVFFETYGDGYWLPQETRFKRVEIYGKPCKEFGKLVKLVEKYSNLTIGDTDVFDVRVCGKRSSWSDSGRYYYLCYNPNQCQHIIDFIRREKSSKDKLSVEVKEYFSYGDEEDYRCAMHQESEWYGCRGNELHMNVRTPKGKDKAFVIWKASR